MILMSLAGTGHAGKLEDFERDATEKKQDVDERPPEKQRDDDRFTYEPPDDNESIALLMAVILPLHGATQSWARVTGEALLAEELLDPLEGGRPVIASFGPVAASGGSGFDNQLLRCFGLGRDAKADRQAAAVIGNAFE